MRYRHQCLLRARMVMQRKLPAGVGVGDCRELRSARIVLCQQSYLDIGIWTGSYKPPSFQTSQKHAFQYAIFQFYLPSTKSSRQEYWSRVPFPTPKDLPNPGIKPRSLAYPALAGGGFSTVPPGVHNSVVTGISQ